METLPPPLQPFIPFSSFFSLGPRFPALGPLGSLGPPVPLSLVPEGLLRILEADVFISCHGQSRTAEPQTVDSQPAAGGAGEQIGGEMQRAWRLQGCLSSHSAPPPPIKDLRPPALPYMWPRAV